MVKKNKDGFLSNVFHYVIGLVFGILILIFTAIVMIIPTQNEIYAEKFDKCIVRGMFGK